MSWKGAQKPGWNYLKRVHCSGKKPLYTHFWRKGLFKHEGSHNRWIGEGFFASRDEGGPRHNNMDLSRNWVEIPGGYWISARFWVHRGRFFTWMRRKHLKLKGKFVGHGQRHRSHRRRQCGEMVDVHIKSAIGAKINRAVISPRALCTVVSHPPQRAPSVRECWACWHVVINSSYSTFKVMGQRNVNNNELL